MNVITMFEWSSLSVNQKKKDQVGPLDLPCEFGTTLNPYEEYVYGRIFLAALQW